MIQTLDDKLISQIAAGEVVERPSSIVKELVENSIDANATNIQVFVEEGGIQKITIIDNGSGISKLDLPLVFKNHATSKITNVEDLDNILTLGFRGEAMASISSISQVRLITSDGNGGYEYFNGQISETSSNKGTTVIIDEIFNNIPARKKFLKSATTEFRYILEVIMKMAIANPDIGFELSNNGKKSLNVQSGQTFEQRIKQLLKINDLINVYYDGHIKISGFITDPKISFPKSSNQFVIVNGRNISSATISKAVSSGYGTALMRGQYPAFILNVTVPPNEIDVNVHPRKSEVRFKMDSEIFQSVYYCVKDALEKFQKSLISKIGITFDSIDRDTNTSFKSSENSMNLASTEIEAALSFNKEMNIGKKEYQTNIGFDILKEVVKDFDNNIDQIGNISEITKSDVNQCMQVRNAFIITSNTNGLQIVDQHAASERFLFEKYHSQLKMRSIEKQLLAFPINLELTLIESDIVADNLDVLNTLGFDLELFGTNEYQIRSLPTIVQANETIFLIKKLIEDLKINQTISLDNKNIKIAAIIACHSAIRFGDSLSEQEMQRIISDLKTCENPYTCPHGRPTVHNLSFYELEKIFKRVT